MLFGWLWHQAPFRFRTHEDLQLDSGLLRFESFDLQCDLLTIIKKAQPSLLLKSSAGSDVSLSLEAEALGERVRGDGLQVVSAEMGSRWCLRRWAPEAEIGSRWCLRRATRLSAESVCGHGEVHGEVSAVTARSTAPARTRWRLRARRRAITRIELNHHHAVTCTSRRRTSSRAEAGGLDAFKASRQLGE